MIVIVITILRVSVSIVINMLNVMSVIDVISTC